MSTCEMISVDVYTNVDEECGRPAFTTTVDGVVVCQTCAVSMAREGFIESNLAVVLEVMVE